MPKLVYRTPKYRKHSARPNSAPQAAVTLSGKVYFLGVYCTPASRLEYNRLVAEWLANGRRPLSTAEHDHTVAEVLLRFWRFAEGHYLKNGEPTGELENIRYAVRPLNQLYGHTLAREFGPLSLKSLQQQMIADGLSRGVVNSRIGKLKRVFKWAVSEQLVPTT